MWSCTDYILGTDRRLFGNVSVRDPRHNSDHYLVLGCLRSASLKAVPQGTEETTPPTTNGADEGE